MNSYVHIFITSGRFASHNEMRSFIDPTYTEDGDIVLSNFMSEVSLKGYDPMCIEAVYGGRSQSVTELLKESSYANQWIGALPPSLVADSAICLYCPNETTTPDSSLNRPGHGRHPGAILSGSDGGVYERQAVHGGIQARGGAAGC